MSNFLRNGRKIVAIGRNYVDHAKELGNAVPKGESELMLPERKWARQPCSQSFLQLFDADHPS